MALFIPTLGRLEKSKKIKVLWLLLDGAEPTRRIVELPFAEVGAE
jgi:hypothetical protein